MPAISLLSKRRRSLIRRIGSLIQRAATEQATGYWKRRKIAVGLVALVHVPAMVWAAVHLPLASIILGLSFFLWTGRLVRTSVLRGWSVRLPAEVVADLLRAFFFVLVSCTLVTGIIHRGYQPLFIVEGLTFFSLCVQVLFFRGRPASWVRILGSPSNLGAAVGTFQQCMDLLGRDGCRFAPFRADRPDFEAWERRIGAWMSRGETVLVLEDQLRPLARRMRRRGDVIFAEDCLLFTSMEKPAGPVINFILGLFNKILAAIAVLILWPLALLIAALIKFDDGGPVFFAQERVGKGNRRFNLYKFRTMSVHASRYAASPTAERDPRVTRVGWWMRRCSLDELPQLINVFRGEMRLVGPRPEMPFIVEEYDEVQRLRLTVKPGITGLWQVSPHRNEPIHDHIEYDLAYIAHRGPTLDLALIISTAGLASGSGH